MSWTDTTRAPHGFTSSAVSCGLKSDGVLDLVVIDAGAVSPAAAIFTTNVVAAAPVVVSRSHVADGRARACVINAGNANACTGEQGLADARAIADAVAAGLGCDAADVIVCSTGVIGVPLPSAAVLGGVSAATASMLPLDASAVAQAIMTTDTFPKSVSVEFVAQGHRYVVTGVAKGSGMIRPDMATMIGALLTDAPLTSEACDVALRRSARTTFNRVTVDGDTSTNDTLMLVANGAAGGSEIRPDSPVFDGVVHAIHEVCGRLARMIARDGEGATKLVEVVVSGAADERDAELAAFSIADSPLVKTALFGNDANWGRVAMAAGKSGASFDPSRLAITFAGVEVCRDGGAVPFDEDEAFAALDSEEVAIRVDLGAGQATATVLTCDLSYEYVRINGEYRS